MPTWSEELSNCNIEYFSKAEEDNRAWGKEIRRSLKALMDSRLAKYIAHDEYVAERLAIRENVAEYERRRAMLARERMIRTFPPPMPLHR